MVRDIFDDDIGCTWSIDWEGNHETTCNNKHTFITGNAHDNGYKYCPYCGQDLIERFDGDIGK